MPSVASSLDGILRVERTTALRALLRRPLFIARDDGDLFKLIVRHREHLARWYAEHLGWKLVVDAAAGFARLHKTASRGDQTMPAQLAGKSSFDRRRYVLLMLSLAALEDCRSQTTLARLAELVVELSREDESIQSFDTNLYSERRAFVDVLKWLVDHGVLVVRDGDAERFANSRDGDALYDINERVVGQLLSAPFPPALATSPADIVRESYPATEDGERLRSRHSVNRRALEKPVVYYEDLTDKEVDWLNQSRAYVYGLLAEAGLLVERHKEGFAAVDPAGEVTDTLFPDGGSTAKHAALLLSEHLVTRLREQGSGKFSHEEVHAAVEALMADYGERCHWSRTYLESTDGTKRLTAEVVAMLAAFELVRQTPDGLELRPAIARFIPAAPRPGV